MKRLIVVLALGGCANLGYQSMTPEQIAALAKMKDANVNCVQTSGPMGRVITTFVNLDKGVVPSGNVTVDGECKVTITNAPVK